MLLRTCCFIPCPEVSVHDIAKRLAMLDHDKYCDNLHKRKLVTIYSTGGAVCYLFTVVAI